MRLKFILVHVGPIHKYPPAMAVLQTLSDFGYEVVLCTTDITEEVKNICDVRKIKVINIKANFETPKNQLDKLSKLIKLKKEIWKEIDLIYDESSVLWVFSDATLKHLGRKLLERKYVLHMFELSKEVYYHHKIPIISVNMKKYAQSALCVIQAEYNRSHISKIWWDLEKLPVVFPNKPYQKKEIRKYSSITDKTANLTIEKIKGRKIILYQGNLGGERPLENLIKAVDRLGNEYAFVVMSGSEDIYEHINSDNYFFIPYVSAPLHLEITSHAFIGVMSYVPVKNGYSKLNALYCAPNKIYEYSMFGIPMIGNDIPGLSNIFRSTNSGVCVEKFDEDSIVDAIAKIENEYTDMSFNSKKFYNDTNVNNRIKKIINEIVDS
ncbi:hypothetical protein BBI11_13085 [Planococcus maritimus]|uniref:glycosyltransferase n=1 Tax=Planococcus maritimus TaxID=192421 RepID=UPI00080EEBA0|nr:glycosyltransferase [Planococcus maritimus]ANU17908.1 hypothetical protein BBI11_13085 [Planococcus maritimus]